MGPRALAASPGLAPWSMMCTKSTGKVLIKTGVKGLVPACCLPLWGREGISFTMSTERNRIACHRASFENQSPIFRKKSDPENFFQIDPRFFFTNRDLNRDRKFFRKNRSAIFISNSIRDLRIKIDLRSFKKNRSAIKNRSSEHSHRRSTRSLRDFFLKIDQRSSGKNRIPKFIFKSIRDFFSEIAITIAIKNFSGKTGQRFRRENRSAVFLNDGWERSKQYHRSPMPSIPEPLFDD